MNSEQITQLMLALIGIVSALISAFIVPYIRVKTTKEQREHVYTIIKYAVLCAEQIYKQNGYGIEKYDYVVKYIKDFGVQLDEKDLKVLIESAVKELNLIQQGLDK